MATAAFKSTSKQATTRTTTNPNSRENPLTTSSSSSRPRLRRSSSVSAVSRISSQDASSEFSNKRDNPLFWTSNSPPSDQVRSGKEIGKIDPDSTKCTTTNREVENRGRSTTRSSGGVCNGIGRSLSRVRGRSVSRGHYESSHESERGQDLFLSKATNQRKELKNLANTSKGPALVEKVIHARDRVNVSQIAAVRGQGTEFSEDDSTYSMQNSTWDDGISISSLSEADDKSIKAFGQSFRDGHWSNDTACSGIYEAVRAEVRRAMSDIQNDLESVMRRNNVNTISTNNAANIPLHLNPGIVESLANIRREYSRKLEESEERTRQLKADLAVEGHRGQELNRILKEIVPDRQNISPQISRISRRRSNERKKMSQRLNEEAMAYFDHFDECVSISTFDGSDFSAPEDPPHSSIGATFSDCRSQFEPQGSMEAFSGNKKLQKFGGIGQLSFMHESPKSAEGDDDIRSCIKRFERQTLKDAEIVASHCDASEYKLKGNLESLWSDRMLYSKRIDSGGLLLCGGGIVVAGLPFGFSI